MANKLASLIGWLKYEMYKNIAIQQKDEHDTVKDLNHAIDYFRDRPSTLNLQALVKASFKLLFFRKLHNK